MSFALIKVPTLPESVTDALLSKWYKKEGEWVEMDAHLLDLETDKVMLEVSAPQAGILRKILFEAGATVDARSILGEIDTEAAAISTETKSPETNTDLVAPSPVCAPQALAAHSAISGAAVTPTTIPRKDDGLSSPSMRRASVSLTQKDTTHPQQTPIPIIEHTETHRSERRVPMSRLRVRIAERLVQAQHEAAILTTFNEIDMKSVMDLRAQYKSSFEKTHQVRLGFMSFFTKAVVEALKRFPSANASIDGRELIYHDFYDIGVAIGSARGLVVPIIRNAERLSMAEIEQCIRMYAEKANANQLTLEEITGGTFSITNGGTYGSLLSTPIINPPQTAILGMHNIVERPVALEGTVVIRPMMYVALSYDHRVIDGQEAVLFLRAIKDMLEDPARILLEI